MTMTMSRIIYNNQRKRECERTLAALPTNMGVMINKHATERPECKPTLTCVGVYTNLGSANLGWCPFEIERPSVFVLVLRYTWHHLTSPWNRIPRHAQANAFYDGLLAHLLIVPAWVIPPAIVGCFCHVFVMESRTSEVSITSDPNRWNLGTNHHTTPSIFVVFPIRQLKTPDIYPIWGWVKTLVPSEPQNSW
jgi:hypothetical protein